MNYYLEINTCPTCNRYDRVHIGKSSCGWTFSFQGFKERSDCEMIGCQVLSYKDWLEVLPIGIIINEDGKEVSLDEFKEKVESKRYADKNHTVVVKGDNSLRLHAEQCWLDDEGHSFTSGDFS